MIYTYLCPLCGYEQRTNAKINLICPHCDTEQGHPRRMSQKARKSPLSPIKTRRHHNNTGYRQIKRGKTVHQVERMAARMAG